jgi:hypothetical protein
MPSEGLLTLLLDCGTEDDKPLEDPSYPGLKRKRSTRRPAQIAPAIQSLGFPTKF